MRWFGAMAALALVVTGARSAAAAASVVALEPFNSCSESYQISGPSGGPVTIQGRLAPGDVDYVLFRTFAERIAIEYAARPDSAATLTDPLLGVFSEDCTPLAREADGTVRVPADGGIVVAFSAAGDLEFIGAHQQSGNYTAVVAERGEPIAAVYGQLIGAADEDWAAARVVVQHCEGEPEPCLSEVEVAVESDGRFRAAQGRNGQPLRSGAYFVRVKAPGYAFHERQVPFVPPGADFDLGRFILTEQDIDFELVRGCQDSFRQAGECAFRVRLTNHSDSLLRGAVWSVADYRFEVGPVPSSSSVLRPLLHLPPGASRELSFRIPLPSPVPEGFALCASIHAGLDPLPQLLHNSGEQLFCLEREP